MSWRILGCLEGSLVCRGRGLIPPTSYPTQFRKVSIRSSNSWFLHPKPWLGHTLQQFSAHRLPVFTHGRLRTFHQKNNLHDTINFRDLYGANLVTRWLRSPQNRGERTPCTPPCGCPHQSSSLGRVPTPKVTGCTANPACQPVNSRSAQRFSRACSSRPADAASECQQREILNDQKKRFYNIKSWSGVLRTGGRR